MDAPLVDDGDFVLHVGDVRDVLRELPAESVHCVVTSPPYWGLRDYGTGEWEGGDAECDHLGPPKASESSGLKNDGRPAERVGQNEYERAAVVPYRDVCGKCGARRVDRQLGLEPTPEEYVANMVEVFREVRRVLRADGTCWLNLGDSYAGSWGAQSRQEWSDPRVGISAAQIKAAPKATNTGSWVNGHPSLKPKDLVGIPWRVAFALQADGWYLRSDIIWSKPNPMPESVTDRPTKAHEYVFLLTKSPRYFFDQEAVRETAQYGFSPTTNGKFAASVGGKHGSHTVKRGDGTGGRNIRSVWEIATQPYAEAHFATFPEALVERCLKAGTSERGCCPECGAPWVREVEARSLNRPDLPREHPEYRPSRYDNGKAGDPQSPGPGQRFRETTTTGWKPSCDCYLQTGRSLSPGVVLDPFLGSGTTALVARRLGRKCIGVELSPEYAELAARRLQQLSLLA